MHATVIVPFHFQGDIHTLQWTLEGFARQQLSNGHTLEVLVGIDGGQGATLNLPLHSDRACRFIPLPLMGVAAIRNALVKQVSAKTDLLIFTNADTRPETDLVQCHIDTMAQLPAGALVLGSAFREQRGDATVFDALLDETPLLFPFPALKPGTWHPWFMANMFNLAMRRADFLTSGGFREELRPLYFEDIVLAHQIMGGEPHVFYQPQAKALHRHPLTFDQYLDREELIGIMAPVLARAAPEVFAHIFGSQVPLSTLAQRYSLWAQMDRPVHQATYQCLRSWTAQPQSTLGNDHTRGERLDILHQLHMPLKRLAYRLGFLRGLQIVQDTQWHLRRPQGLWRETLRLSELTERPVQHHKVISGNAP